MSVDKFGHFSNSTHYKKNVSKIFGIFIDRHNNIDIQYKKIKNLDPPAEDTDAVNKAYLQKQIYHSRDILKRDLNIEVNNIRQEITQMKISLSQLFELISTMPENPTIIYNNHN